MDQQKKPQLEFDLKKNIHWSLIKNTNFDPYPYHNPQLLDVNPWKWGTLGATAARNFTHRLPRHPYRCSSPAARRRRRSETIWSTLEFDQNTPEKIWRAGKVWYPTWPIPNQKSIPIPIPIKTKIALWFFGVWEEDTPAVRPETESAQHEHVNLEQRPAKYLHGPLLYK